MARQKIMQITWTDPAIGDLDAIADYIALDNQKAAEKLVSRVFSAAERLAVFPEIGRRVP